MLKLENIPLSNFSNKGDIVSATLSKHYTLERKKNHQGCNFLIFEARLSDKIVKKSACFNK